MKYLAAFVLAIGCCYGNYAVVIQETLEEANRELRIELLKNCPEQIPTIVEWEYQDWHSYDKTLTRERLFEAFNSSLNDDRLPLILVAFNGSVPIGVISLEAKGEPEFVDLEDGNPWGGSFHVVPEMRNQGIGAAMAQVIVTISKRMGYQKIHFFTSREEIVGMYASHGAKIIGLRPFRGHQVTVMEYTLTGE